MRDLSERKREVLYAVLKDYIASAQPVGSAQVSEKKGISLSSATVRHVMAELEELGFLRRAHASSGRIPTDLAYRYYVDNLMQPHPLAEEDQRRVRDQVRGNVALDQIIREACHFVSSRVEQPGVAVAPKGETRSLKEIHFLSLRDNLAIGVLVFSSGVVETKPIQLDRAMKQHELDRIRNYLNERLTGRTVSEVRQQILLEMKQVQHHYDDLLNKALMLSQKAFSDDPPQLVIEGQSYLFSEPEFADVERMQQILRTLEEKTQVIRILDLSLKNPGIQVFIGDELAFAENPGMSLITSAYTASDGNRGLLGVLGPTRMNYSKIVPLLEFTSRIVTEVLREEEK